MSRSKKKPIVKDKPRNFKASTYWRRIRREWSQTINGWREEELQFRNSKEIINDYDYSDYQFIITVKPSDKRGIWWSNIIRKGVEWDYEDVKKYSRK